MFLDKKVKGIGFFFLPKIDIEDNTPVTPTHREYILRSAVLVVTGALTINPVSIFSGNIACFGLKQGCSAETELIYDSSQLSLPMWLSFGPFFKLQFIEVKLTRHFSEKF